MVYFLIVVGAVIVIAAIAYGTQRKSRDGVASFKRQIDALSPQARKPVVDQVQSVSDLRKASGEKAAGEKAAGEKAAGGTGSGSSAAEADPATDAHRVDPASGPGDHADGA